MPTGILTRKLNTEAINVLDYNAALDGVTDDTTALTNAINAALAQKQLAAPTAAPSCTGNTGVGSSFTAAQVVKVAISYTNARGETSLSPVASVTITSSGNNVVVTLPSFPSGVTGACVYAGTGDGVAPAYRVSANSAATSTSSGGTVTITQFAAATISANNYATAPTVNSTGGGLVYIPSGRLLTGPQTIYSNVYFEGNGHNTSIIQLKSGSNADLFSAYASNINLAASASSSDTLAVTSFGFRNLTLDGNKSGQASGTSYVLRVYGLSYSLNNVRLRNGYSGGLLSDWNARGGVLPMGETSMESQWSNVKVYNNNGIGVEVGGPHDTQVDNLLSFQNGDMNLHVAPNMTGFLVSNMHVWGAGQVNSSAPSALIEAPSGYYSNCEFEGSTNVQAVVLASEMSIRGGKIFAAGSGTSSANGLQYGQGAGNTPFTNQVNGVSGGLTTSLSVHDVYVDALFSNFNGSGKAAVVAGGDGGQNTIRGQALFNGSSGGLIFSGALAQGSTIDLQPYNLPNTTGATNLGGLTRIARKSSAALVVTDTTNDILNVNAQSKRLDLPNATTLQMWSDAYTTGTLQLAGGTVNYYPSTSAQALSASPSTVTTGGVGIARVAPTANVTGVIMATGIRTGQQVLVVNESAHTVTFDVAGTSNVADGSTSAIPANTARLFVWDSATSLWYRAA